MTDRSEGCTGPGSRYWRKPEEERKKSVNIYLTQSEKACLDALRGNTSISNFIKRKLGLTSKDSEAAEVTDDV